MKIRAKDIAKELNLSTATVSLAINNRPGVNEETRQKVLDYIEKVKNGETDETQESERVIRMISFLEDRPYWDSSENVRIYTTYEFASIRAKENGFKTELVSAVRGRDRLEDLLRECVRDKVSGVYLNAAYMTWEEYECFRDFEIPFVVCDQDFEDLRTDHIFLNNRQGVTMGLQYLYDHGHRDIMYFRNSNNFYNMYRRREAYRDFIREKNLMKEEDVNIIDIGGTTQEIYERMLSYLEAGKKTGKAIFCENFEVTIGVSKALTSKGYRIPEDISIVGFDQIPGTALMDFEPTCICCPHEQKANVAAGRLIERINGYTNESVKIYVNTALQIGNSVRKSE